MFVKSSSFLLLERSGESGSSSKIKEKHLMCMVGCFACKSVYQVYNPGICGIPKKPLGPLELELQIVVSHYVGAGNLTQVVWKSSQCS